MQNVSTVWKVSACPKGYDDIHDLTFHVVAENITDAMKGAEQWLSSTEEEGEDPLVISAIVVVDWVCAAQQSAEDNQSESDPWLFDSEASRKTK